MVLVLADVAVDVGLVYAVGIDGILEVLGEEDGLAGVGAHLVVVVHEVHGVAVAVGGAVVPVVHYVVEEVQSADGDVLAVHAATHRPVAALAVHQQVVVPRAYLSVDGGGIAVVGAVAVVLMAGDAQCLEDAAVLERDVLGAASADRLVGAPGGGAVVYDAVVGSAQAHGVARVLAIDAQSALEADVAADDVRADVDVRCLDADALARCRLSGDGGVGLDEVRREVQLDDAADVEDDGIAGSVISVRP